MTVVNPNSISGITSITMPSGGDNVLTIHTNDGIERFRIDSSGNVKVGSAATISPDGDVFFTGVCTATTLAGDGSGLTGVASTDNIRTNTNATFLQNVNVSGITTVGSAVTISESGIEASGIGITVANINGTQIGGRRNIVINGKAQINQRGDSTGNTSSGYYGPDRFDSTIYGGTFSHSAAASGSTLPEFPKCFRMDCTSAASAASGSQELKIEYAIEGQDIQHLQYGSSSAKSTTLSFYVRSNKTETYTLWYYRPDGTRQNAVNFSISAADTWEKKIITIVGDTSSAIADDNTEGMKFGWILAVGGDMKSGTALNGSWATLVNANRYVGNTGTFGESTSDYFDITGVQLEVGSQATPFEHRSFGEELKLCERYCETIVVGEGDGSYINNTVAYATNQMYSIIRFRTPKRATNPTLVQTTGTDYYRLYRRSGSVDATGFTGTSWPNIHGSAIYNTMSCTEGDAGLLGTANALAKLLFTSEL